MKLTPKKSREEKVEEARRNTTIKHREQGQKEYFVEKQGNDQDSSVKTKDARLGISGYPTVGLAKGATISMGEFEFMRIDAWITDEVLPGETPKEVFEKISGILDEVIQEEAGSEINAD